MILNKSVDGWKGITALRELGLIICNGGDCTDLRPWNCEFENKHYNEYKIEVQVSELCDPS